MIKNSGIAILIFGTILLSNVKAQQPVTPLDTTQKQIQVDLTKKIDTVAILGINLKKSLTIKSDPIGATVIFDSIVKGQTPIIIADIDTGMHQIEIRKKGFYLKKIKIHVDSSTQPELSYQLLQPGTLNLVSTPDSAKVFVDNSEIGLTPISKSALKPGPHSLRFIKDGFTTYESTVNVTSGSLDTVSVKLVAKVNVATVVEAPKNTRVNGKVTTIVVGALFAAFAVVLLISEATAQR